MSDITNCQVLMWRNSLTGIGEYHCKLKSGREGDWLMTGFSQRIQYRSQLSVQIKSDYIDRSVLKKIIRDSVLNMKNKFKKKLISYHD